MSNDPSTPSNSDPNRDARGNFAPGNRCGRGRPAGSRNRVSLLLDEAASEAGEGLLRATIAAAVAGDMQAAALLFARIWPARRGRPVGLSLPAVETAADVSAALGALIAAVAAGDITPDEASAVASLLNMKRAAIEAVDLEARVAALEEAEEDAPHEAGATACRGNGG